MTTLTKEQVEYQKWAWKVVDRLLTMATVIAATDTEMLRSKEEIQRELAEELSKISVAKFQEAFLPSMALALQAIDMRPRPISDLPEKSCAVLIWPIKVGRWIYGGYFNKYQFESGWRRSEISHFIPLSSLPTGGENE